MTPEWVKTAKVGDEVVCIAHPKSSNNNLADSQIEVNTVYKITGVFEKYDDVYFTLGFIGRDGKLQGYCWDLFRPVKKSSTDKAMKQLKSLLHGAPVKELTE